MEVEGLYSLDFSENDSNPVFGGKTITETAVYGKDEMATATEFVQFVRSTLQKVFNRASKLTKSPSSNMKVSLTLCSGSMEHHSASIFVRILKPGICPRTTPVSFTRIPESTASALVSYVPLMKSSRTRLINSVKDFANLF